MSVLKGFKLSNNIDRKIYNNHRQMENKNVMILVETDFSILSIFIIHVMVLLEVGRKKDRRNKNQDGRVEQR